MENDGPTEEQWLWQLARVLFDLDRKGHLVRLNEPDPESAAPLAFFARGRVSSLVLFRADAPSRLVSSLPTAAAGLGSWSGERTEDRILDPLRRAVRECVGETTETHGPAFRFGEAVPSAAHQTTVIEEANAHLLDANFPYTRSVLGERAPVAGIVRDGVAVSACYSARRRPDAAEAGVDTVERFRGQGLAVAVVSAWAQAARRAGLTPLYSTSWSNAASLRVAAKLRLETYADTLSFC